MDARVQKDFGFILPTAAVQSRTVVIEGKVGKRNENRKKNLLLNVSLANMTDLHAWVCRPILPVEPMFSSGVD